MANSLQIAFRTMLFLLLIFNLSCKEEKKFSARSGGGQTPPPEETEGGNQEFGNQDPVDDQGVDDKGRQQEEAQETDINQEKLIEEFIDTLSKEPTPDELEDAAKDFIKQNSLEDVIDKKDLIAAAEELIQPDEEKGPKFAAGSLGDKLGLNAQKENPTSGTACNSLKLQEDKVVISFASTKGQNCKYSQNGNLSKKNKYVRARIEQFQNAQIDANRIVCSFELSAMQQNFNYDDNILITLNEIALLSNMRFMQKLTPDKNNFYRYEWGKLLNTYHDDGFALKTGKHCIAGTTRCELPKSEMNEPLNFVMNRETNKKLSEIATSQNRYRFGLVITGDNENNDCEHSGLNLTMAYKYVLKK